MFKKSKVIFVWGFFISYKLTFSLIKAPDYANIDQDIHQGKIKVVRKKKLVYFYSRKIKILRICPSLELDISIVKKSHYLPL